MKRHKKALIAIGIAAVALGSTSAAFADSTMAEWTAVPKGEQAESRLEKVK